MFVGQSETYTSDRYVSNGAYCCSGSVLCRACLVAQAKASAPDNTSGIGSIMSESRAPPSGNKRTLSEPCDRNLHAAPWNVVPGFDVDSMNDAEMWGGLLDHGFMDKLDELTDTLSPISEVS